MKSITLPKSKILLFLSLLGTLIISCSKDDEVVELIDPTASFKQSASICIAPCSVDFDSQSKHATDFSWSFGNGETSTEESPNHIYTESGYFEIKLTTSNEVGTDDATSDILVLNPTSNPNYGSIDIEGISLIISSGEFGETRTITAYSNVKEDIEYIESLVPTEAFKFFQTVNIRLEDIAPDKAAWYNTGEGVVERHNSIEIVGIDNFIDWRDRVQPFIILHEYAHAYHHQVLGFNDVEIQLEYLDAVSSGIYDNVEYILGGTERAYALTNHLEFFAEITEAYFGENDFYPFTRSELLAFDSDAYNLVVSKWNVDQ